MSWNDPCMKCGEPRYACECHDEERKNTISNQSITTKTLYKIRDKNTGLFSSGGMSPSWTTKGKTWNQLNHLKCHLRQFIKDQRWNKIWENRIPDNWEVVEIKYTESNYSLMPANMLYPITNVYQTNA